LSVSQVEDRYGFQVTTVAIIDMRVWQQHIQHLQMVLECHESFCSAPFVVINVQRAQYGTTQLQHREIQ
jgi:hypothetical protein